MISEMGIKSNLIGEFSFHDFIEKLERFMQKNQISYNQQLFMKTHGNAGSSQNINQLQSQNDHMNVSSNM